MLDLANGVEKVHSVKILNINDLDSHPFIKFNKNVPSKVFYKKVDISIDDLDNLTVIDWKDVNFSSINNIIIAHSLIESIAEAIVEIQGDVFLWDITNNTIKFIGNC